LRSFYRESIVAVGVYTPIVLALFLVDVREPWVLWGSLVIALAYVAMCVHGLRRPSPHSWLPLAMHASLSVGVVILTRITSPLLVFPVMCAMMTMVALGHRGGAPRWTFAAFGIAPILSAAALEGLGLWSPTMVWRAGTLEIHSALLDLDAVPWVIPVLVISSVFPVVVGTILLGRVHDLGEGLAREAHVQRWQLQQLVE
jgi:hypothetical protein